MTFETKTLEVGRRAANIVELDLDRCSLVYGEAPCTADLALRNDLNYSEDFTTAGVGATPGWSAGSLMTANAVNAPDGTLTADEFARIGVGTIQMECLQDRDIGLTTEGQNTAQAFKMAVKPKLVGGVISERYFGIAHFSSGTPIAFAWFDLQDVHSMGTSSAADVRHHYIRYMAEAVEPGWYEVGFIYDSEVAPGTPQLGFFITNSAFDASTTGAIGDGVYIWGAQVRQLGLTGQFDDFDGPNAYGKYVARVTAIVDGTGSPCDLCYNTFATCQDTPNFSNTAQPYKFIDRLNLPTAACDYFPAVKRISYGATQLDPGGGLAVRGKVTVTLQDFTTNDVKIDDYTRERAGTPETQGTFFGKLLARNKFWLGRTMRVLEGYIDEPFDVANFRTREYIIENIVGPDKTGKVSIVGKDPLSLTANNKAKCPVPSTGVLDIAITTEVSFDVDTGSGGEYVTGEHIRIDDEIMLVNTITTDTLGVTRAQGGTTVEDHEAAAAVQLCKTYTDEPVIDIIQELLEDFAGVPTAYIPFADWQAEETASLSGYDLTTIISEPTGVQKLLKEIVEVTLLDIWYSDTDQEIKLKLQTPFTDVTQTLNDDYNVLEKSLQVKTLNMKRLTRVLIYYGVRNFARDLTETENYSNANFEIEADKEGANKFNDIKTKVIFSRWMDASNAIQIALTSQRLLKRFGNMPVEISFDLDAKDVPNLQTGDVYDLETRIVQGADGLPATTRMQVIETKPIKPSSRYKYKSLAFFEDPTADSTTVTANETDYNLFVELGGPPGPVDVTVTINALVFIRGTDGNPAFTTEGMHPDSTVVITNNGTIYGHGGDGGQGGDADNFGELEEICYYYGTVSPGGSGDDGGDAIECTVAELTIDNTNGEIFGGGGGGGGGTGWKSLGLVTAYGGGGGGGGRGSDNATFGTGGPTVVSSIGCGPETSADGADGLVGDETAPGTGGAKGGLSAADGGDGGEWGTDGDSVNYGSGGAAGFAVRLNGASIIWLGGNDAASVKGSVA